MIMLSWKKIAAIEITELFATVKKHLDSNAPVYALLHSPKLFSLGYAQDGELIACHPNFDMRTAYNVRLFNGIQEIRWQQVPGELKGAAVVIAESTVDVSDCAEIIGRQSRTYLLWGKTSGQGTMLADPRIGSLKLPPGILNNPHAKGTHYQLRCEEYFGTGADGNTVFLDERLVAIESDPRI